MGTTAERIIEYLKSKKQATPAGLSDYLGINRQATHRQINKLLRDGIIYKIGKPPKVFYLISNGKGKESPNTVSDELKKLIDENFLTITPSGEREEGFGGFKYWCQKQNLTLEKTALEYKKTIKKYFRYNKNTKR